MQSIDYIHSDNITKLIHTYRFGGALFEQYKLIAKAECTTDVKIDLTLGPNYKFEHVNVLTNDMVRKLIIAQQSDVVLVFKQNQKKWLMSFVNDLQCKVETIHSY